MNQNPLQRMWASASVCLVVSPLAFVFGGALVFGAINQSYGADSRGWLVIALAVSGMSLFTLGVTAWSRAFSLIGEQMRARRRAVDVS